MNEWNPVGSGTPLHAWLETRLDGEEGVSISMCRLLSVGDEPEWIARDGRTTVTHSTYAAPSHWRWPEVDEPPIPMSGSRDSLEDAAAGLDGRPRVFCWVWGPLGPQPQIMFDDVRNAGARILVEHKLEPTDTRSLDELAAAYPAPAVMS